MLRAIKFGFAFFILAAAFALTWFFQYAYWFPKDLMESVMPFSMGAIVERMAARREEWKQGAVAITNAEELDRELRGWRPSEDSMGFLALYETASGEKIYVNSEVDGEQGLSSVQKDAFDAFRRNYENGLREKIIDTALREYREERERMLSLPEDERAAMEVGLRMQTGILTMEEALPDIASVQALEKIITTTWLNLTNTEKDGTVCLYLRYETPPKIAANCRAVLLGDQVIDEEEHWKEMAEKWDAEQEDDADDDEEEEERPNSHRRGNPGKPKVREGAADLDAQSDSGDQR